MNYVEPAEACEMDGLRLALTAHAPVPYGMSARAILDYHGVRYVPVLQVGGGRNEDLVAWTGHRNAPVAVYNDEAPRVGWLEILYLAERLGSGPTFDLANIEQPVVDLTPSPAVSSFVFYEGDAFPAWRHHVLVGTLKATELYRVEVAGDRLVHRETLITDLARIRDVEVGVDGLVHLLLEHASGGRIVRLVPATAG